MEIDVTTYVEDLDCYEFSASAFEMGDNVGQITWRNAMDQAADEPLAKLPSELQEIRDWIADFGAWDSEEIDAMTDQELNALLIQFVAGDVRESEAFESLEEFRRACEDGSTSGRLYPGDNGRWYFYVGN